MKIQANIPIVAAILCCMVAAGCNSDTSPVNNGYRSERRSEATTGFYIAGTWTSVYGYNNPNQADGPPICVVDGGPDMEDVGLDFKGNLIVPNAGLQELQVYSGPGMCGHLAGTIQDQYGHPADAASFDAINGTIVVANDQGSIGGHGGIALCTLAKGCTSELSNPIIRDFFGVALAPNGSCWGIGFNRAVSSLVFFKRCGGHGTLATGFSASRATNVDIDSDGNFVIVSAIGSSWPPTQSIVLMYRGCNPRCVRVGGPFALIPGFSNCGHLNKDSSELAVANYTTNGVDIYKYSLKALKYLYSFKAPVVRAEGILCVTVLPRSSERKVGTR